MAFPSPVRSVQTPYGIIRGDWSVNSTTLELFQSCASRRPVREALDLDAFLTMGATHTKQPDALDLACVRAGAVPERTKVLSALFMAIGTGDLNGNLPARDVFYELADDCQDTLSSLLSDTSAPIGERVGPVDAEAWTVRGNGLDFPIDETPLWVHMCKSDRNPFCFWDFEVAPAEILMPDSLDGEAQDDAVAASPSGASPFNDFGDLSNLDSSLLSDGPELDVTHTDDSSGGYDALAAIVGYVLYDDYGGTGQLFRRGDEGILRAPALADARKSGVERFEHYGAHFEFNGVKWVDTRFAWDDAVTLVKLREARKVVGNICDGLLPMEGVKLAPASKRARVQEDAE